MQNNFELEILFFFFFFDLDKELPGYERKEFLKMPVLLTAGYYSSKLSFHQIIYKNLSAVRTPVNRRFHEKTE